MISECLSGNKSCSTLTVSGVTLNVPGGLNWNKVAGDLVVDDPKCNNEWGTCLYSMSVSGSTATVTRTTPLHDTNGGGCDVDQGVFAPNDKYFAGGCIAQGSDPAAVARAGNSQPAGTQHTRVHQSNIRSAQQSATSSLVFIDDPACAACVAIASDQVDVVDVYRAETASPSFTTVRPRSFRRIASQSA